MKKLKTMKDKRFFLITSLFILILFNSCDSGNSISDKIPESLGIMVRNISLNQDNLDLFNLEPSEKLFVLYEFFLPQDIDTKSTICLNIRNFFHKSGDDLEYPSDCEMPKRKINLTDRILIGISVFNEEETTLIKTHFKIGDSSSVISMAVKPVELKNWNYYFRNSISSIHFGQSITLFSLFENSNKKYIFEENISDYYGNFIRIGRNSGQYMVDVGIYKD